MAGRRRSDEATERPESLGGRLRAARIALGLTQPAVFERADIPVSSQKKYEGDHTEPSADALTKYASLGVNVNYLLLGEGGPTVPDRHREAHADAMRELLLNDPEATRRQDARLKRIGEVTRAVISGVNDALQELQITMPEDKKTELISTLMELYLDAGSDPQKGTILRLVKSAA